jgi:holo-[acyl-carrier protein] synthase
VRGTILGLGTDLCAVARMVRALGDPGAGVLPAVFTGDELDRCSHSSDPAASLAACFAAKEAVLKALALCRGTGSFWQDIEIEMTGSNARVRLRGRLGELAASHGVHEVLVGLGRCRRYATASALAVA